MSPISEENEKLMEFGEFIGEFETDGGKSEMVSRETLLSKVRGVNLWDRQDEYEGEYSPGDVSKSEMASCWENAKEDWDKDRYEECCWQEAGNAPGRSVLLLDVSFERIFKSYDSICYVIEANLVNRRWYCIRRLFDI